MAMKFTASRLIKRFGFRNILVGNAVISAAFLASYALIGAQTPHSADFPGPADRRLFPLAGVHRAQRDRLCRRAAIAHEPGDQFRQRLAADVAGGRRRAWRRPRCRACNGCFGDAYAGAARHAAELLRRRRGDAGLDADLPAAEAPTRAPRFPASGAVAAPAAGVRARRRNRAIDEHGQIAPTIDEQGPKSSGSSLPPPRDTLFDDTAAKVGVDQSLLGASHSLRKSFVVKPLFAREAREPFGPEHAHIIAIAQETIAPSTKLEQASRRGGAFWGNRGLCAVTSPVRPHGKVQSNS